MIMEGFLSQQFYTKKGARKLSSKEIKEEIRLFSTDLTGSLWHKKTCKNSQSIVCK